MARGRTGQVVPKYREDRKRWEARITVGHDTEGKQVRRKFVGPTSKSVADQVKAALRSLDDGVVPASRQMTVKAWLKVWLDDILPGTVSAGTLRSYSDLARLYVEPHLGTIALVDLQPRDVSRMTRKLAQAGKSANTQRLARTTLVRALKRAEQEGLVARNVAKLADGVRVGTPEGKTMTADQARTVLEHVAGDRAAAALVTVLAGVTVDADQAQLILEKVGGNRMEAAFVLALTLGLRRGELLGLTWDDLDLTANSPTVMVRRQLKRDDGLVLGDLKTRQSRRRLHLSPRATSALAVHRVLLDLEAKVVGPGWPAAPLGADLVFRTPLGTAFDPDNFGKIVKAATKAALGEEWTPHHLRHSTASLLFADGVPLKVISEVMGHSSVRITADVYAHLMDEAGVVAADAIGRQLA